MVKTVHLYFNLTVLGFFVACALLVVANNYYRNTSLSIEAYSTDNENITSSVKKFGDSYSDLLRITYDNLTDPDWLIYDVKDKICDSNDTKIIAIVPSSVQNFELRKQIRNSWASEGLVPYNGIRAIFIVGATTNRAVQRDVEKESETFGDVIQTSFIDAYRNLTYKTISALMWILENCSHVPWVAKVDDDVIMNPFNLKKLLNDKYKKNNFSVPPAIYGRLRTHSPPMSVGKWVVTKNEYPYKYYPKFILGSAYIIGQSAVKTLVDAAKKTPFLWLEDVFVTGLVAESAKIKRINIERDCFVTRISTKLVKGKAIFLIGAKPKMYKYAWTQILKFSVFMRGKKFYSADF